MTLSRVAVATIAVVALIGSVLGTAAGAQPAKPKAEDIGITPTQIRLAIVADVDTPVDPGLFQAARDEVNAWAAIVNKHGGIAGRKVVIDFYDSKLSPSDATNATIQACSRDFAMVGNEALFMDNVSNVVSCKDAQGKTVGLPDIAGLALDPAELCSPVTYTVSGDASFCPTVNEHPQTYNTGQGDFVYYLKNNKNLHGVFVVADDTKPAENSEIRVFDAGIKLGVKEDATGIYMVSATSPQAAMTPVIQAVKANNSNFVYNGSAYSTMAELRKEAVLQGANSVKVWACNQGCYDNHLIQQGGSDVENTYSVLTTLPFYSEYNSNASLKALVQQLGTINKVNGNGLEAYLAALLFQDAAQKAVAGGGPLTRSSLLAALKTENSFTGQGILGPTDVAAHKAPACIVMTQIKNGKWVRVYPTKVGSFDCNPKNTVTLKLDQSN